MNYRKIVGYILFVLPFIVIFGFLIGHAYMNGYLVDLLVTLGIWLAIVACMSIGAYLVNHN